MQFLSKNKPFIVFGVILGLAISLATILLAIRKDLGNEWNITLILEASAMIIMALIGTLIITRRFWNAIFVQKEPKRSYLAKQVNYMFLLAILMVSSMILDFISGSFYVLEASKIDGLTTASLILTILITILLIIGKFYLLKSAYRNLKINFARSI